MPQTTNHETLIIGDAPGLEYELLLIRRLRAARVPCWTEAQLRGLGYHKTPDVRLQVPIAVRPPRPGAQWRVVTWIDSKATFGDDRMHAQQLDQQYRTYVNRYGPGLVIYWFGFIDDLDDDPDVLLLTDFPGPDNIRMLPQLPDLATPQRPPAINAGGGGGGFGGSSSVGLPTPLSGTAVAVAAAAPSQPPPYRRSCTG